MNDQIKTLWKQAGGHYNSGNQHTWPEYTIDNPEKFAELIIRECADCVDFYTSDGNGPASDVILNHFGVKE